MSKELRGLSATAASELKALHKLDRQMNKEEDAGNYKQLERDEKRWAKLSSELVKTQTATEHEEHLLAAAPMNPKGEIVTPGSVQNARQYDPDYTTGGYNSWNLP
jgi:hypothetical protein